MKLRKRYFLLILLAILPFYKLLHFNDYCFGDVDLFMIGVLSILFIIAFIATVFYNLYRISLRNELFNFRPLIIAGVFSLALFIGLKYHNNNPFKDKVDVFKSLSNDNEMLEIVLFDNNTFEFRTRFNHNTCVEKGTYSFERDTLVLKKNNEPIGNTVFDKIYIFNKTYNSLNPMNNSLQKFTLEK